MSADSTLNAFVAQGTTTQRLAFTPTPPTPASGSPLGYYFWDHTLQQMFAYDTTSAAWVAVASVAGTGVTGTGLTSGLVVIGAGSSAITVKANSIPMLRSITTLTDAQIKALPTTAITLVAAPGSGFAICPLHATLYSKTTSGAYTNINASGVLGCRFPTFKQGLSYVPNDPAITNGSATLLSDLLGTTTNQRCSLIPTQSTEGVDDWGPVPFIEPTAAGFDNQPLQFDVDNNGAGNFTGGNAANTLTAIVYYTIETIP